MSNLKFKTRAQDRLYAAVSSSATTLYLDSVTGFPSAPFPIVVEPGLASEEMMVVSAVSTVLNTLTVTRAQQGTAGVAHAKNALVYHSGLLPIDTTMLITSKDDNATLTADESGLILITVDNKTMTLPTLAVGAGLTYIFKATCAVSTGITIDGSGGETIDGQASVVLYDQYETLRIVAGTSEWHII